MIREDLSARLKILAPSILIPSFHGDTGARPFSGEWWSSPAIRLVDPETGNLVPDDKSLDRGKEYQVRIHLRNIGLLPAIGIHVEVYSRFPSKEPETSASSQNMKLLFRYIEPKPITAGGELYTITPKEPSRKWGEFLFYEIVHFNGGGKFIGAPCIIVRAFIPIFPYSASFDCRVNYSVAYWNTPGIFRGLPDLKKEPDLLDV